MVAVHSYLCKQKYLLLESPLLLVKVNRPRNEEPRMESTASPPSTPTIDRYSKEHFGKLELDGWSKTFVGSKRSIEPRSSLTEIHIQKCFLSALRLRHSISTGAFSKPEVQTGIGHKIFEEEFPTLEMTKEEPIADKHRCWLRS